MRAFLGIDVGSVRTKLALVEEGGEVIHRSCSRTLSDPIQALRRCFKGLLPDKIRNHEISRIGVTGSARELVGMFLDADVVKNEISAHARAVSLLHPEIRTVIEIGGQDSKLILMEDGQVTDFAMNAICAAGTGSFLEQQAKRLGLSLDSLGSLALKSREGLSIAGRCTVFAESDMVYKQQMGYAREDIIYGLCLALARNYLNTMSQGKDFLPPIAFQGGVAANLGMRRAFEELLGESLTVPRYFLHMGALGAAFFASGSKGSQKRAPLTELLSARFKLRPWVCEDCDQRCRIMIYSRSGTIIGVKGDLCGKYTSDLRLLKTIL